MESKYVYNLTPVRATLAYGQNYTYKHVEN